MTAAEHECPQRPGLLTERQFAEAAQQTRMEGATVRAAQLVLVHGQGFTEAAKLSGIEHRQHVYRAVRRIKAVLVKGGHCAACGSTLGTAGTAREEP